MIETKQKLDKLGRRNNGWSKPGPGRPKGSGMNYEKEIRTRITKEDYNKLKKKADTKSIAEKLREYIEWGLENDHTRP